MEFSIKMLVVVVILVIALIVFLALIAQWGKEGGSIIDRITDVFKSFNFLQPPTSPTSIPG